MSEPDPTMVLMVPAARPAAMMIRRMEGIDDAGSRRDDRRRMVQR